MADAKIFAGPRVRRLRQRLALTQAAMAQALGISPSYLNLIERDQRPLTAQTVLKLVSTFDVGAEELQPSGEEGAVPALKEVFADPLLAGELPGDGELIEIADAAPNAAQAIVKLYRAYGEQRARLTDLSRLLGENGGVVDQASALPLDTVRNALERAPWCFPSLELAAERIGAALNEGQGTMAALYGLLRDDHGLSVQVLPVETMPTWRMRIDRHSGRLFVSERLTREDRAVLLAQELVLRREREAVDEEVALLGIDEKTAGAEAVRLARMELSRYAALALLMPYERFLRAAERVRYDPEILAVRFDTGFAQIAHRLVSLQDRSRGRRAGLPFFALEVDRAGTILRRIGAKGFPTARFGGACPKLPLYAAFAGGAGLLAERVLTPEGEVFFTLSKRLEGMRAAAGERPRATALLLATADPHARATLEARQGAKQGRGMATVLRDEALEERIAHAALLPVIEAAPPTPIGPACRLCERMDCTVRSAPPLTQPEGLDELTQGFGAWGLT